VKEDWEPLVERVYCLVLPSCVAHEQRLSCVLRFPISLNRRTSDGGAIMDYSTPASSRLKNKIIFDSHSAMLTMFSVARRGNQ
jgi:hypothetical protein